MPIGDYEKDEFTPEELAALGKAEGEPNKEPEKEPEIPAEPEKEPEVPEKEPEGEPPKEPETEPKGEPSPEEKKAAEGMGFRIEADEKGRQYVVDDDGTRIPPTRWKKLYREHQTVKKSDTDKQKKLDLLKERDPDRYYDLCPEEKPEGYVPKQAARAPVAAPDIPDHLLGEQLTYQLEGHPYHGMTLNQIYAENPAFARELHDQYRATVISQRNEVIVQQRVEAAKRDTVNELNQFSEARAEELFGKDVSELTADEEAEIVRVTTDLMGWMTGKRALMPVERAYLQMRKEQKRAKEDAAKGTLKTMTKEPVKAAGTGRVDGKLTGDESYLAMSSDQFANAIDDMADEKLKKLMETGSDALRKKYPKLAWKQRSAA